MSIAEIEKAETKQARKPRRARGSAHGLSILATGEPFVWITGGALILCLVMIAGLLWNVIQIGGSTFIPRPLVEVKLHDGRTLLGEVVEDNVTPLRVDLLLDDHPANTRPFLSELVTELGNLDNLPSTIVTRTESLHVEREATVVRLKTAHKHLQKLTDSIRGQLQNVKARHKYAIGSASRRLAEAKTAVETLEGRIAGIDGEIAAAEAAAKHFESTERDLTSLVDAPYEFKGHGYRALLDLVAKKRGDEHVKMRERRLRTENYELTNTHQTDIAEYQIAHEGESLPPDAALLERIEDGRFYGTPIEFVEIVDLARSEEIAGLQAATELLTNNQFRLSTEQQVMIAEALAALTKKLNDQLKQLIEDAFHANQEEGVTRMDLASKNLATGEYTLFRYDEHADLSNVAGIAKTWVGPEVAWQNFKTHHHEIRELFHERKGLQKHELGHEYAKQEKGRLKLRQAEIDHDVVLISPLTVLREIKLMERLQIQSLEKVNRAIDYLAAQDFGNVDLAEVGRAIRNHLQSDMEKENQDSAAQKTEIDSQFADLPVEVGSLVTQVTEVNEEADTKSAEVKERIDALSTAINRYQLTMRTCDDRTASIPLGEIVRGFQANKLDGGDKRATYFSRWWEFLSDEPREANSEGGVLPAIWGTISMTIIMSLAVVPFGVVAALYLREYAKSGPIVSAVRIAINNLAGVPSIVFGVFGLGFFCSGIGSYIDGGPKNAQFPVMPPTQWFVFLGILAVISVGAFILGVVNLTGPPGQKSRLRRVAGVASVILWIASFALFVAIVAGTPFFNGFYEANLPDPYWGKGGVLWAALTLALMTLPVVIVATEETLAAVPNSMREGSYGCGASKWQTIRRVVLPQALPGIMTGMILAMARGAGEVAPLMLVGAVKVAPELPVDTVFPFVHANRSFMHLGFHIFDLGFQSQNSEAAKPVVYTTTLLLIAIVTILNVVAIWLRSYLRKRFTVGQF